MHREPEVLEAEAQVGKWLDCRARITSKELCTNPFCEKWHPPEYFVPQVRKRMQVCGKML